MNYWPIACRATWRLCRFEAVASSAVVGGASGANASQGLIVGQQLLGQLRDTKPVGRLVIDVQGIIKGRPGGPDDVIVKDGDKLVIPKKTQEITILGEVQSPTSHVFEPGLTRDDYIAKSGGATQKADRKRIYIVRANGDVVSGGRSGWFRRSQSARDAPRRYDRGAAGHGTDQPAAAMAGRYHDHL